MVPMPRQRSLLIGVLGLTLMVGPLVGTCELKNSSSQTPLEWLAQMRQATLSLSYQGVVAYVKDQQVDSFRVYHQVMDGHERERLVSMNSPIQEVVRTDGTVSRYSADTQQVVVETRPSRQSVLINIPEDPSALSRFYKINLRGQEFVAGSLAQVVALEPKDGYRYARLIWIDTVTRLPLKVDVLNEDGQSVEQMVFTALNAKDQISRTDLEPSSKAASAIAQVSHRESRPLDDLKWTIRNVPEGFQIISYSILKRPPNNTPVEHILLSDGFSSVSVYIEANDGKLRAGARKLGAISIDSVRLNDYMVTVMGEVPAMSVESIANGLQPKKH
jgi:sigma-E factor negative regulatory protein RseB